MGTPVRRGTTRRAYRGKFSPVELGYRSFEWRTLRWSQPAGPSPCCPYCCCGAADTGSGDRLSGTAPSDEFRRRPQLRIPLYVGKVQEPHGSTLRPVHASAPPSSRGPPHTLLPAPRSRDPYGPDPGGFHQHGGLYYIRDPFCVWYRLAVD